MDAFWPWNFIPFIDYFLLGEMNKHYKLPPQKKIIFGEESDETIFEKLKVAKVIMIHGDHFPEWAHFLTKLALDDSLQLPIKLFLSFGSDYKFSDDQTEILASIFPSAKFWIQNWCGLLPQVELLPIGFDNNAGLITVDTKTISKKYTVVISCFTLNSIARREFVGFLDKHPELATLCAPFYDNKNEFFIMLGEHYFSVCPAGNGYDTYRFWESIHARSVPIVLKNEFTENLRLHYPNLPMILLDSWEDLFTIFPKLNKSYYDSFWQNADISCATNHFWISKLSALVNTP